MVDWWNTLPLMEQFFYGIGFLSLSLTIILAILTVIGLDGTSTLLQAEAEQGNHRLRILSLHTISAFLLGFGWGGVLCLKVGLHPFVASILSLALGVILMALMYLLMAAMIRLHFRSDLDFSMAIGAVAEVYITVPANRSGRGKIRVRVGVELTTANAETKSVTSFKPGDEVRVVERIGKSNFLVKAK